MNYYKLNDEFAFPDSHGVIYIEVDDDDCTIRQVIASDEHFIASNVNYPEFGFVLPDQCVSYDDSEEFISISKQDFEAVWNEHLAQHQSQWEVIKAEYPIGKKVLGAILIFYPQGVIIDLGTNALGVADYAQCHSSARPEWMYPEHKVKAIVEGYDEDNHWIKLQEPRVLPETISRKIY